MNSYLSILSVLVVSLISLVGVFTISVREDLLKKYISLFVSLAVGALLGDAFIHLIPEGFEKIPSTTIFSLLIILGIIIFFVIEKYMHWHHHFESGDLHDTVHPVGKMVLFSDGVHNFIDGLIIASSYAISVELGIATTIAVILHEIPQEIGDFGVLLHSGFSRTRALWLNFASALTAVIGVIVVIIIGEVSVTLATWLIPFAAGGFIYIALSDLIPELHRKMGGKSNAFLQLLMIVVGILSMLALLGLE